MDFLELAKERYSVRSFDKKPVPQEIIDKIIEAAVVSPTAKNIQPQKIYVVKSEEAIEHLDKSTECRYGAPLAFIICYDKSLCYGRRFDGKISGDIDASIITTHMMLEATSLGVGTVWVMNFDPVALRKEFELPDNIEPVALLVTGYPAGDAEPSPRHSQYRDTSETIIYK